MNESHFFRFITYKIAKNNVAVAPDYYFPENEEDRKLDFRLSKDIPDRKDNNMLMLKLGIVNAKNTLKYELIMVGFFEKGSEDISKEELKKFMNTNAPAILFPFMRAIVAAHTALLGIPQIILPTINFVSFDDWVDFDSNSEEL